VEATGRMSDVEPGSASSADLRRVEHADP